MTLSSKLLIIVTIPFSIHNSIAQDVFTEAGVGLGNIIGEEHPKGKAEIYINVLKSYNFGEIGLDISTGGNFIPGNSSGIEDNIETLSPNDAKFTSISAFYRLPLIKDIFVEPRFGYSSLFYYIHADNERKINKSNITYGLGIGTTLFENLSLSLRYQNFGNTPNYEGTKETTTIISRSESLNLVLLRVAYRFNWNSIF
jgi:hypothetical protein